MKFSTLVIAIVVVAFFMGLTVFGALREAKASDEIKNLKQELSEKEAEIAKFEKMTDKDPFIAMEAWLPRVEESIEEVQKLIDSEEDSDMKRVYITKKESLEDLKRVIELLIHQKEFEERIRGIKGDIKAINEAAKEFRKIVDPDGETFEEFWQRTLKQAEEDIEAEKKAKK